MIFTNKIFKNVPLGLIHWNRFSYNHCSTTNEFIFHFLLWALLNIYQTNTANKNKRTKITNFSLKIQNSTLVAFVFGPTAFIKMRPVYRLVMTNWKLYRCEHKPLAIVSYDFRKFYGKIRTAFLLLQLVVSTSHNELNAVHSHACELLIETSNVRWRVWAKEQFSNTL